MPKRRQLFYYHRSGETRIPVAVTKRTGIQNFLKFTVKSNKTRPVGDLNLR